MVKSRSNENTCLDLPRKGPAIVIGRSGSGKTLCADLRMENSQELYLVKVEPGDIAMLTGQLHLYYHI